MAPLTKTRSVLDRTGAVVNGRVLFEQAPDGDDPKDQTPQRLWITLSLECWSDLGSPDEISVAVEPGNTLGDD